jgi:segregation and condensation protein B
MPRAVPIASNDDPFDPDDASQVHEDAGLSLEELSQTYAQVLERAESPYSNQATPVVAGPQEIEFEPLREAVQIQDDCPVTPKTILEAILFVGHPESKPLSAERIAGFMRGVRPAEIEQYVEDLNAEYQHNHHAMEIVVVAEGYQLKLVADLHTLRERMYGRIKETRLNQDAIDCLALVAYQPGITREEIDRQWNRSSGAVLAMLIRRNLLELRKLGSGKKSVLQYYPTERLMNLIGVASLAELPQVEDFD